LKRENEKEKEGKIEYNAKLGLGLDFLGCVLGGPEARQGVVPLIELELGVKS